MRRPPTWAWWSAPTSTAPAVAHQPGVDELIQGGLGELGGELAAQVVQNQQVAVEVPPGLIPRREMVLNYCSELLAPLFFSGFHK